MKMLFASLLWSSTGLPILDDRKYDFPHLSKTSLNALQFTKTYLQTPNIIYLYKNHHLDLTPLKPVLT